MSGYHKLITELATAQGRPDVDPAKIDHFMRLEYGTLDHLSREKFRREVAICIQCVDATPFMDPATML